MTGLTGQMYTYCLNKDVLGTFKKRDLIDISDIESFIFTLSPSFTMGNLSRCVNES